MEALAKRFTHLIYKNNSELDNIQLKKIEYGLICILEEISKTILYFAIFGFFSSIRYFIVAMLFFGSLRVIAGGYHSKGYWSCFFTTLGIFVISIYIGRNIHLTNLLQGIMGTIALGLFILFAPVDHPNKPILSDVRRKKIKILSILFLFIAIAITFFMPEKYSITARVVIFIEAISLPFGKMTGRSS